jgi:hypothetical protein
MLLGVELLAETVKVTLGPKGRNVVIDKCHGAKNGVTVPKESELSDSSRTWARRWCAKSPRSRISLQSNWRPRRLDVRPSGLRIFRFTLND